MGTVSVANRISKVVTKTGDFGTTGLGDGSRRSKDNPRVQAIGDIDEANCAIGLILSCLSVPDSRIDVLMSIQHRMFDLGGEISIPHYSIIDEDDVDALEELTETLNETLPPLKNFILPSGGELVSRIHMARAIVRRAERSVVELMRQETINKYASRYLNRLSDYLFVLARHAAWPNEVLWEPKPNDKSS